MSAARVAYLCAWCFGELDADGVCTAPRCVAYPQPVRTTVRAQRTDPQVERPATAIPDGYVLPAAEVQAALDAFYGGDKRTPVFQRMEAALGAALSALAERLTAP